MVISPQMVEQGGYKMVEKVLVTLKMSPHEKSRLQVEAKGRAMSLSELIRERVLYMPTLPTLSRDSLDEIAGDLKLPVDQVVAGIVDKYFCKKRAREEAWPGAPEVFIEFSYDESGLIVGEERHETLLEYYRHRFRQEKRDLEARIAAGKAQMEPVRRQERSRHARERLAALEAREKADREKK